MFSRGLFVLLMSLLFASPVIANPQVNWVTTPDGIKLATFVYLPQGEIKKYPTILIRTPYAANQNFAEAAWVPWVNKGIVFVFQHCRGTGLSQGVLDPLIQEFQDGKSAVEWITNQPWSNGSVGTVGGSYEGYTALAAALDNPSVKMVIADGSITDTSNSWPGNPGKIPTDSLLDWLTKLELDVAFLPDDLKFQMQDAVTNLPNLQSIGPWFLKKYLPAWNKMAPHLDKNDFFWKERDLKGRLSKVCAPTLHVQANMEWSDDQTKAYEEMLSNKCQNGFVVEYLKSDQGHASTIFLPDESLFAGKVISNFINTHLLKSQAPASAKVNIAVALGNKYSWLSQDTWPKTQPLRYYLGRNLQNPEFLQPQAPLQAHSWTLDYVPATANACHSFQGIKSRNFVGGLFVKPITVVGSVGVSLRIKKAKAVNDLFAYFYLTIPGQESQPEFLGKTSIRFNKVNDGAVVELNFPTIARVFPAGSYLTLSLTPTECGAKEVEAASSYEIISGPQGASELKLPALL